MYIHIYLNFSAEKLILLYSTWLYKYATVYVHILVLIDT